MSRALVFPSYGGPDVLQVIDVEPPKPGARQVLVKVKAAGVQPFDTRFRNGDHAQWLLPAFPQGLGTEFAGVVDTVGDDVTSFAPGDEVIGWTSGGAQAEYARADVNSLVAKPANMPWEEAGALVASGQTAHTALQDLGVGPGETVLIHAAAGGVGTIAVQLAKAWGAKAIGTASERNHGYLKELGAIPVSYGNGLVDAVRAVAPDGVDAALDASGTEAALRASLKLVADKNRIGTIAAQGAAAELGLRSLRTKRSISQVDELIELYNAGCLKIHIQQAFPLDEAATAHRAVEAGHVRGKIVVVLD